MKKIAVFLSVILMLSTAAGCRPKEDAGAVDGGVIKVACIGASNTRGYQLPDLDSNCYPGQLQKIAGDKWLVMNYGVGGSTIMKSGDIPYWQTLSFKTAQEFEPDIVIFDFGWNDLKPVNIGKMEKDFVKDYSEMIKLFAGLPSRPDIYIILPPLYDSPQTREGYEYLRGFYGKIIRKNNITPIDVYTPVTAVREYFNSDLVHYSVKGCGRVAEEVYKVVSEDHP